MWQRLLHSWKTKNGQCCRLHQSLLKYILAYYSPIIVALLFFINPISTLSRILFIDPASILAKICWINPASILARIIFQRYKFYLIKNYFSAIQLPFKQDSFHQSHFYLSRNYFHQSNFYSARILFVNPTCIWPTLKPMQWSIIKNAKIHFYLSWPISRKINYIFCQRRV